MNEKQSIRQYNFEKVYWSRCSRSNSIASKKHTIQIQLWNHIVSLRKSVLCSHITFRFCRAETRSRRTRIRSKRTENIWSFRILIDLILWQILFRSEKLDSALFASMYARNACRAFDALLFLSISRSFDISYELSTVKSHRYRLIDVAKSIWEFWNSQWCYQIMMWFALSSISHYSNTEYLFLDVSFIQF